MHASGDTPVTGALRAAAAVALTRSSQSVPADALCRCCSSSALSPHGSCLVRSLCTVAKQLRLTFSVRARLPRPSAATATLRHVTEKLFLPVLSLVKLVLQLLFFVGHVVGAQRKRTTTARAMQLRSAISDLAGLGSWPGAIYVACSKHHVGLQDREPFTGTSTALARCYGDSNGGAQHGRNIVSRPAGRMSSLAARRERSLRGGHRGPLCICWVCWLAKHVAPIVDYQALSIEHRALSVQRRVLCFRQHHVQARRTASQRAQREASTQRAPPRPVVSASYRHSLCLATMSVHSVYSSSLAAQGNGSATAAKSVRPC